MALRRVKQQPDGTKTREVWCKMDSLVRFLIMSIVQEMYLIKLHFGPKLPDFPLSLELGKEL